MFRIIRNLLERLGILKPRLRYTADLGPLTYPKYLEMKEWCEKTLHSEWNTGLDILLNRRVGMGNSRFIDQGIARLEIKIRGVVENSKNKGLSNSVFFFADRRERDLYVLTFKGTEGTNLKD